MSVSVLVGGSPTVVADQIPAGTIANLGLALSIYTGAVWLPCDGSAVSRTSYSQLFAAIGTSFGPGDGATTFNLPIRAKLSNRPLVSLTTSNTFAAFAEDTDIVINNGTTASIDISAGAAVAGIRINIIEKSAVGVTVYTDAAHTQSGLLLQGTFLLEWDGAQWHHLMSSVRTRIQIVNSMTWKAPFTGTYKLTSVGGGGGGGTAGDPGAYTNSTGGGGGGGAAVLSVGLTAGTPVTVAIGSGGASSSSGGATTMTVGSTVVSGPGGNGAAAVGAIGSNGSSPGGGGGSSGLSNVLGVSLFIGNQGTSGSPSGGAAGTGGNSVSNLGTGGAGGTSGNAVGSPGGNYGGGGGGAHSTSTSRAGGTGAPGCAFIEF